MVQTVLQGAGVAASINEAADLQQAGMSAITGRVVSEAKATSGTSLLGLLLVVLGAQTLLLFRIILKRRIRAASYVRNRL